MSFRVDVDMSDLDHLEEIGVQAKNVVNDAGRDLAAATHAHIVEEANKKLHSRRGLFIESLTHHQVDKDVWVVSLEAKARWIDEGMDAHSMVHDLLSKRSPNSKEPKRAKDGSMYRVIPFAHNKGATSSTPAQQNLLATIKTELKARGIPYGKKEVDASGKAKLGKLHSFNITKSPIKTANAPGQGKGPIGKVMQGPTGIPLLQGVSIYQREVKDKSGGTSVKREIMTFRIVSSKHEGTGRWEHPGLEPANLMDEGLEFAKQHWEKEVGPKVLASLVASIG